MMLLHALGFAACLASTTAGLPQLHHTYVTRSAEDISYVSIYLVLTATTLWFAYGLGRCDRPVMLSNALVFATWLGILLLKRRFDALQEAEAAACPVPVESE
jgi:MtN3 and saliva related transmembrane protein